ncbi:heparan-alpha-glucosaminide N-acetyltransferase domain-containing protein [Nocardiopsis sp. JB363]|uniref:heparan-alpha-glucosaminide N-acetyltransferase domain-containing protein n=1 Tax=Nocardiopsis sp. JB363 TaxID=1434837 RepID=UPI00097B5008|nr:heparan-alpha-glucosaminide N-acetyltransferase domain-containing protein [Nocardiopsis sp. JB363]SIO85690.1 Putative membrane protein [Nocardiopsis sp. JB363]
MAQNQSDDTGTLPDDRPPAKRRVDGIDAARALAVFGMFAVHLGVVSFGLLPEEQGWELHGLVRGNSSALFAFLAGVSLALMSGRTEPIGGVPLRRVMVKIVARSVTIGLLGLFLDSLAVPVAIILTYYAGFFVLALPLIRARAVLLWIAAATLAVFGPVVSFLLRQDLFPVEPRTGALTSFSEFFLTGYYPAITFMAFMFAGMAVGRMDLTATAVRVRLAVGGAVMAAVGYLGPWTLLYPMGGLDRLTEADSTFLNGRPLRKVDAGTAEELRWNTIDAMHSISGQVPTDSWWWLAVGTPHTGTTFEMFEAVGQALLVLVICVLLAERLPRVMYPLTSVGRMPLTVYTGHILVLAVIVAFHPENAAGGPFYLEWFILGSFVFATLWRYLLGRGPLERGLGEIADGAVVMVEGVGGRDRRG